MILKKFAGAAVVAVLAASALVGVSAPAQAAPAAAVAAPASTIGIQAAKKKTAVRYQVSKKTVLRKSASAKGKKVATLKVDATLTYRAKKGKFLKVSYGKKNGYVSTGAVRKIAASNVQLKSTQNLTAGAGNGRKLAKLSKGSIAKATGMRKGGWRQVTAKGKTGWVRASALTTLPAAKFHVKSGTTYATSSTGRKKAKTSGSLVLASSNKRATVRGLGKSVQATYKGKSVWVPVSKALKVPLGAKLGTGYRTKTVFKKADLYLPARNVRHSQKAAWWGNLGPETGEMHPDDLAIYFATTGERRTGALEVKVKGKWVKNMSFKTANYYPKFSPYPNGFELFNARPASLGLHGTYDYRIRLNATNKAAADSISFKLKHENPAKFTGKKKEIHEVLKSYGCPRAWVSISNRFGNRMAWTDDIHDYVPILYVGEKFDTKDPGNKKLLRNYCKSLKD